MSAPPIEHLRPTWAEIDLDAVAENLAALRGRTGTIPVLAVIKADAYGHGAVEVARTLEQEGIDCLGVALPEEGIELRRAGVRTPVLLLGGLTPAQADVVLAHDLTPAVYRADQIEALSSAAARRGTRAHVHLKVDSGMGRLGVTMRELPDFARRLAGTPWIDLEGAFSHLASADNPDDPFTRTQIDLFARAVEILRADGLHPERLHLANSAGILDHAPSWLTLVRPGIVLYGYPPSARATSLRLKPVLSLRSRVIYLKDIEPGTSLGYGRTYVAPRPARIATLALGYDDGLPFQSGNRGHVILRDRRAPIVGRVSMDLTTVDVTDIPDVSLGDIALVLGRSGSGRIGADEIAGWTGTHAWDVLCGVGARVPRLYQRKGRHLVVSRFDPPLASSTGVGL